MLLLAQGMMFGGNLTVCTLLAFDAMTTVQAIWSAVIFNFTACLFEVVHHWRTN